MSEIIVDAIAEKHVPQQLFDVFTPLVTEAKIHFNNDGIHMRAVDPANIAMNYVDLDTSAFESYESPGAVTQGINLEAVTDRLAFGDGSDLVHLSLDMETRKLNVDVENFQQQVALINPDAIRSEPDVPDLDLPNTVELSGGQMEEAVQALDLVSDHVELAALDDLDGVAFKAEGDTDATTVEFGMERVGDRTDVTEAVASLYSQEYLEKIVTPIPSSVDVTVEFGDEFPVIMEWEGLDGALSVTQMLAPRIQRK
jgi:proliferating cell nuclear antigen